MNSLRRLVHSCTALNRNNNVQWRPMSYDAVKELIENLDPRKKAAATFDTVTQNTIHRMNLVEDMGKLLYPGSLSTVPKNKGDYLSNCNVALNKLIDFDSMQIKNKLSIMSMKCPTLLLNELVKACTAADYLDIHIIQLSYENYEDPEKGRKDCLLAANEIAIRMTAINRWTYFSASATSINPGADYLCLFKSEMVNVREEFAANLHAQVRSKDGCVKITFEPFDKTVGVIYTNGKNNLNILRFFLTFERVQ